MAHPLEQCEHASGNRQDKSSLLDSEEPGRGQGDSLAMTVEGPGSAKPTRPPRRAARGQKRS